MSSDSIRNRIPEVVKRSCRYFARIILVGICLFFGVFILEAFDPHFGWQSGLAHLVPTICMVLITIYTWTRPKQGGILFLGITGILFLTRIIHLWQPNAYVIGITCAVGIAFLIGDH